MRKKCVFAMVDRFGTKGAISGETSSVGTPVSHTVDVGHHRGAPRLSTRGWRHLQVEGVGFCLLELVTPCFWYNYCDPFSANRKKNYVRKNPNN